MARRYGLEIAFDMFAELFRRRRQGEDIKVSRALERNFANPSTPIERQIKADIEAYQAQQVSKWEKDLFAQKKRLADAERSLQTTAAAKAHASPSNKRRASVHSNALTSSSVASSRAGVAAVT
jgi:hypothetical protein